MESNKPTCMICKQTGPTVTSSNVMVNVSMDTKNSKLLYELTNFGIEIQISQNELSSVSVPKDLTDILFKKVIRKIENDDPNDLYGLKNNFLRIYSGKDLNGDDLTESNFTVDKFKKKVRQQEDISILINQ